MLKLIKQCLIVLLYLFLPWSLTCYVLIGAYYLLWGKKYDASGDTGTAVLFGAPLIPLMLGYIRYHDWRARKLSQEK